MKKNLPTIAKLFVNKSFPRLAKDKEKAFGKIVLTNLAPRVLFRIIFQ